MARPRMVVISPLPELSELTRRICRELNYQIDIVDGFLDEGVAKAIEYQEKKADVIISRGPTGILIQKKVSIPVILIQITTFDIMQALHRARKVGENIAYLEHVIRKDLYDFTLISEIMSIKKPRLFYYQNERQLEKQINRAKEEGIDVIIASGVCIIRMAREKGMEGVMIYSSREAVVEALQRAQEVVQIRQKDQEKNEFLQTIIDHTQTGVIAVDRHNIITHVSPVAGSLLKLKGSQLVGMPIKKVGHPFLLSFFQDSTPLKGEVHRMGNSKVLVNKLPICVGNCYLGLVLTMQEVNRIQNLEAIIRKELYAKGLTARYSLSDIVGKSPQIKKTVERARKFARSDSTILITGESGTGKELFAHGIHKESSRSQGPFVAINCAALPKDLLESELFGYVEGAFTGAKKGGKAGLFELAHMGTILLDEVSELSLPLQSNLLRVLQEKAVRRIGGDRIIPVDVRVIAATNRNLVELVHKGLFRRDLFFRLNVLDLNIPPLRERKEDIALLVDFFRSKYQKDKSIKLLPLPKFALKWLQEYDWPGNVRELENLVEKFMILDDGGKDSFRLFDELIDELYRFRQEDVGEKVTSGEQIVVEVATLEEMEKQILAKMVSSHTGDKKVLAQKLGISRTTLWKKLKEIKGGNIA